MVETRSQKLFSIPTGDAKMLKFGHESVAKNPKTGNTEYLRDFASNDIPAWWTKEWKDFGKVQIEIVKSRGRLGCFVVIRQETTLKELSRHFLSKDLKMKFHGHSDRSLTWMVPQDCVNGGTAIEESHLCVKFKTSDIADEFLSAFEENQS